MPLPSHPTPESPAVSAGTPANAVLGREPVHFAVAPEWLTVAGLTASVAGLFAPWERVRYQLPLAALYARPPWQFHNGFALGVWVPVTVCAVVSAGLLLVPIPSGNRQSVALAQGISGAAVLLIALTHLALWPGVLSALLGGSLLVAGAWQRGQAGTE